MGVLDAIMRVYPYVFHPAVVIGGGALILIHYEWEKQDVDRSVLYHRVGAFLGAGFLSLVPTVAYVLATGQGIYEVTKGNAWQVDALVAGGILVATVTTWVLWRHFDWGELVVGYVGALSLVTVPYAVTSPFWNVSGHVIMAMAPTLYLTLVDRSFWPLLAIPLVMLPNRIYLDAHTWEQTLGGLLVAGVFVFGAFVFQKERPVGQTS